MKNALITDLGLVHLAGRHQGKANVHSSDPGQGPTAGKARPPRHAVMCRKRSVRISDPGQDRQDGRHLDVVTDLSTDHGPDRQDTSPQMRVKTRLETRSVLILDLALGLLAGRLRAVVTDLSTDHGPDPLATSLHPRAVVQ